MAAVKGGGNRQELHEVIREQSLVAWAALQAGQANPLAGLLANDPRITQYVAQNEIPALLEASDHVGDAAERAHEMASLLRQAIQGNKVIS